VLGGRPVSVMGVEGFHFRVWGLGFRVSISGFWVCRQVRLLHSRGIGNKAALLLATMSADFSALQVMCSVLSSEHLRSLCRIAALATDAKDLDASACRGLIEALINTDDIGVARNLVRGRAHSTCSVPSAWLQ
jgi:hypothetical protein